jgi:hypothetical protein
MHFRDNYSEKNVHSISEKNRKVYASHLLDENQDYDIVFLFLFFYAERNNVTLAVVSPSVGWAC